MFFYIETVKVPPSTSRSTKIDVPSSSIIENITVSVCTMWGRLMLTTLGLWEGRGRRHDVFYIESVKVPPSTSGSTTITVEGTIFAFGFSKKVRSFTPSDLRSRIPSLSSIQPICKCWCPPLGKVAVSGKKSYQNHVLSFLWHVVGSKKGTSW